MENFKFRGAVKWGLKIFAPNYQKAHPYAKSGRINRLAYVAVTLFWHYMAARKKYARIAILKSRVVYNTTSLPRRRDVTDLYAAKQQSAVEGNKALYSSL